MVKVDPITVNFISDAESMPDLLKLLLIQDVKNNIHRSKNMFSNNDLPATSDLLCGVIKCDIEHLVKPVADHHSFITLEVIGIDDMAICEIYLHSWGLQ